MGLSLSLPPTFSCTSSSRRSRCFCATRNSPILARVDGGREEGHIETRRVSFGKTRVEVGDVRATKLMDTLFEITQAGDDLCAG